jgi:hypothetical protein
MSDGERSFLKEKKRNTYYHNMFVGLSSGLWIGS